MFDSSSLQKLFDRTLREEEEDLKHEGYENSEYQNGKTPGPIVARMHRHSSLSRSPLDGTMDYDATELRSGHSESRSTARAAMSITREIMTVLMCDLNGTDSANL
jgi:hypothetical protein